MLKNPSDCPICKGQLVFFVKENGNIAKGCPVCKRGVEMCEIPIIRKQKHYKGGLSKRRTKSEYTYLQDDEKTENE